MREQVKKIELAHCIIKIEYDERFREYYIKARTIKGFEFDFKCYKNKGAVNRYLKSWNCNERI